MYCILRIMSCLLVNGKVNTKAGTLLTYLTMADVTDAKMHDKIPNTYMT